MAARGGDYSVSVGKSAVAESSATSLGYGAYAGQNSVSIGTDSAAAGIGSTVIGRSASATASNAVALGLGSVADVDATVSIGNATLKRRLVNLEGGVLSADSTDAVNGAQLHATNDDVAANSAAITATTNITTLQGDVTALDTSVIRLGGRMDTAENTISDLASQIGSGSVGLVQQDATSGAITVGGDKAGASVSFAGVDAAGAVINRTLSGVAAGRLAADSTDAVNGAQLHATNDDVASARTDITALQGDVTILNTSVTSLDTRMGTAETSITQLQADIGSGSVGLVRQDATTGAIGVASDSNGTLVNFAGTAGARTLSGVAAGRVAADSDEAVNGAQLHSTNADVASARTDITTLQGEVVTLDGRMTVNEANITHLNEQVSDLASGSRGLVQQDAATGVISVGAATGGNVVDMTGTDGARRLSGVANGTDDADVATIAQLKASGLVDPNDGRALGALVYDDMSLDRATLGGSHGTVIANLGNGLIAAGSREAVNGGQMWQMNADWEARWNQMDGRVGTIEQGIADGSIGGPSLPPPSDGPGVSPGTGADSIAIGEGSQATGAGSIGMGKEAAATGNGAVAIGSGSAASGDGSVAIGDGASATGTDSVAIGKGSTADRDSEFSVGSEGNERVVSNVGRGTRPTDAVNLEQLEDRFAAERDWSNSRFQAVDKRIDRMGAISAAYAGMAGNMTGPGGDSGLAAGVGAQNGRTALAVGYQRYLGERRNISISLGGAFSGSEQSISGGAGIRW